MVVQAHPDIDEVLLTREGIQERVQEVGRCAPITSAPATPAVLACHMQ
jgi:hypothetical protein